MTQQDEGNRGVSRGTDVVRYVTGRPGDVVYADEIAESVGCPVTTVQRNMHKVIEDGTLPRLVSVIRGRAWRYVPNRLGVGAAVGYATGANANAPKVDVQPAAKAATSRVTRRAATPTSNDRPRLYEEVGRSKGGFIVRGEDGRLYRLEAL